MKHQMESGGDPELSEVWRPRQAARDCATRLATWRDCGAARRRPVWRSVPLGMSLLLALLPTAAAHAGVKVEKCFSGGALCDCVEYFSPVAGYKEVRCPTVPSPGWVSKPPNAPVPSNRGSWRGDGKKRQPIAPHPFSDVPSTYSNLLQNAKNSAAGKLRGLPLEPNPPHTFGPSTCTALFDGNSLGMAGKDILLSYVQFRFAPGTQPECAADKAWVRLSPPHDPYVILCPTFFDIAHQSPGAAANVLIHELLHVAGQQEDKTSSSGYPDDFPTSPQLQDVVDTACTSPQPLF